MNAEQRETRTALRREIGPPTERDHLWQPMVAASEVRELLDALDVADARIAAVETLLRLWDEWDGTRPHPGESSPRQRAQLRAALHSDLSDPS